MDVLKEDMKLVSVRVGLNGVLKGKAKIEE